MKHLVAVIAFASLVAHAQSVAIDVDDGTGNSVQVQVPGVSVHMRVQGEAGGQAGQVHVAPPMGRVVGADTFDMGSEFRATESLRLLSPEGARADIWGDDGSYLGGFVVPCEVEARPGQFYRVVMTMNGALVLDRKFEVQKYHRTNVSFRSAQVAVAPVVVVAPPAPVAHVAHVDFAALVEAVKAEDFGDAKLDVVKTSDGALSVDQLGQLVDLFTFAPEKVKVVEVCASRLLDPQNAFKLYKHFDFDSDKQRVKKILGR